MSNSIEQPFPIYLDDNGKTIESGTLYIGVAGLNPLSNPQLAYWDSALTIPTGVIHISGGYAIYNGKPSRVFVAGDYSFLVQDKNGKTVYSRLNGFLENADWFIAPPRGTLGRAARVPPSFNFDLILDTGVYSWSNAATTNFPVSSAAADLFMLTVLSSPDGTGILTQRVQDFTLGDTSQYFEMRRTSSDLGVTWTTWENAFDSLSLYDLVIDSNAKFLAWQTAGTWERVLVKKGTWTLAAGGVDLDARGTKVIDGETGANLVFTSAEKGLFYAAAQTTPDYHIRGITITCASSTVNTSAFFKCGNIEKCKATITATGAFTAHAFSGCMSVSGSIGIASSTGATGAAFYQSDNLSDCNGTGSGQTAGNGFQECDLVSDCIGSGTGLAANGIGRGFLTCCFVSNCQGLGFGVGAGVAAGFSGCDNVSTCAGSGSTSGTGIAYGFSGNTKITGCTGTAINTGAGTGSCIGFFSCLQVSSCYAAPSSPNAVNIYGYLSCLEITSSKALITGVDANINVIGFNTCDDISGCLSEIACTTTDTCRGFKDCARMSSCYANISGSAVNSYGFENGALLASCVASVSTTTLCQGFSSCSQLTGCIATASGSSASACIGFYSCIGVVLCKGKGSNAGAGAGYGFLGCNKMQGNNNNGASKSSTYNSCFVDAGAVVAVTADTAASGWNTP